MKHIDQLSALGVAMAMGMSAAVVAQDFDPGQNPEPDPMLVTELTIDIKPGAPDEMPVINVNAKGVVPVVVFSQADDPATLDADEAFDATALAEPEGFLRLQLADEAVPAAGVEPVRTRNMDANEDGVEDLVLFFRTPDLAEYLDLGPKFLRPGKKLVLDLAIVHLAEVTVDPDEAVEGDETTTLVVDAKGVDEVGFLRGKWGKWNKK